LCKLIGRYVQQNIETAGTTEFIVFFFQKSVLFKYNSIELCVEEDIFKIIGHFLFSIPYYYLFFYFLKCDSIKVMKFFSTAFQL